jgi:hypothetical protein
LAVFQLLPAARKFTGGYRKRPFVGEASEKHPSGAKARAGFSAIGCTAEGVPFQKHQRFRSFLGFIDFAGLMSGPNLWPTT